MSRRRDVVAGFGILPPDGSSRVLCRRCSRPIRDYLPTVRRTEVVGERAGPRRHPPGRKLARASSPLQQTGARVLAESFGGWTSPGGRARAPCPVARRARLRTASGGREDPPAVRGAGGRDWGAPGPRPLNPEKARPFCVATAAGRRKGSVECPRDGIWRGGEPGSIPLTPKRASPSFVAATAGQGEGSRRISGQQVVFGRLAGVSVLESEGTSPVPLRRCGPAKRAAPSDVRAIECIVGTSQSPCPLLRHRCGRPAPRAPPNVSAMRGRPGPTTGGPMGGQLVPRRRCSWPERSACTPLLPKTASVRGPAE